MYSWLHSLCPIRFPSSYHLCVIFTDTSWSLTGSVLEPWLLVAFVWARKWGPCKASAHGPRWLYTYVRSQLSSRPCSPGVCLELTSAARKGTWRTPGEWTSLGSPNITEQVPCLREGFRVKNPMKLCFHGPGCLRSKGTRNMFKKQFCTVNAVSHRCFHFSFSKQFKSLMAFVRYMHVFWQNLEEE